MKGDVLNSANHSKPCKTFVTRIGLCFGILMGALGLVSQVPAQTIYRLVTTDGKVIFSDKPTATAAKITATDAGGKPLGAGPVALPFELRQVVNKYPLTLYTSNNCAPCNSGRNLLTSHGIPFAEKTVNTPEDTQALQRISGDSSLPFLTIGAQQIRGYSDSEWTQFLDAAGYPKSSALPIGYRNPAAIPLVIVKKSEPVTPTEASPTAPNAVAPANTPPTPTNSTANPTGIQF
jgi:glutaredoxin